MDENLQIYSSILHYRNNLNVIFKKKFANRPVWNTVVAARPGTNEHCMTKEDIATNTSSIYTSRVYCEIAYRLNNEKREGLESIRHLCPFHVSYTLRYETVEQHKKSHINLQLDRRS